MNDCFWLVFRQFQLVKILESWIYINFFFFLVFFLAIIYIFAHNENNETKKKPSRKKNHSCLNQSLFSLCLFILICPKNYEKTKKINKQNIEIKINKFISYKHIICTLYIIQWSWTQLPSVGKKSNMAWKRKPSGKKKCKCNPHKDELNWLINASSQVIQTQLKMVYFISEIHNRKNAGMQTQIHIVCYMKEMFLTCNVSTSKNKYCKSFSSSLDALKCAHYNSFGLNCVCTTAIY